MQMGRSVGELAEIASGFMRRVWESLDDRRNASRRNEDAAGYVKLTPRSLVMSATRLVRVCCCVRYFNNASN
jgi:hypothetical protein